MALIGATPLVLVSVDWKQSHNNQNFLERLS